MMTNNLLVKSDYISFVLDLNVKQDRTKFKKDNSIKRNSEEAFVISLSKNLVDVSKFDKRSSELTLSGLIIYFNRDPRNRFTNVAVYQ